MRGAWKPNLGPTGKRRGAPCGALPVPHTIPPAARCALEEARGESRQLPRRRRQVARGELPALDAQAPDLGRGDELGRPPRRYKNPEEKLWLDRMAAKGWVCPTWPKEYGGGGLSNAEARVLAEELRKIRARPALISFGITMLGPGAARVRQRGAEARAPAQDRARRDPLVPGLQRARRGLRPRGPADARRGQGRPLSRERPEDLDLVRELRRLDLLPRAHRIRTRRSTTASRSCCSTWRRRASRWRRSS